MCKLVAIWWWMYGESEAWKGAIFPSRYVAASMGVRGGAMRVLRVFVEDAVRVLQTRGVGVLNDARGGKRLMQQIWYAANKRSADAC